MVCETNVTIKCRLSYVPTAAKANRRRLWRLAVAPQPSIADCRSVPLRGTHLHYYMYPQLRCFAACSGFHNIGPALRNQQLILEIMSVDAGLRRDAIASYVCSASSYIVVIRNFVLPRKSSKFLTLRRFCRHNICIPNAQYYEFSAQQNLWCEILEF